MKSIDKNPFCSAFYYVDRQKKPLHTNSSNVLFFFMNMITTIAVVLDKVLGCSVYGCEYVSLVVGFKGWVTSLTQLYR